MEKQIEKAEQGVPEHQNAKQQHQQKQSDMERRETEQHNDGERRKSAWDRNGETGESDPPPPGLDPILSSPIATPCTTSNQQQERIKKRSSR